MSGHSYIRASKYRHVYASDPKPDTIFSNYRFSTTFSESNLIRASATHFIVPLEGNGGPLAVLSHDKPGRFSPDVPIVHSHSAPVLDFDFSPFYDNMFSSCSEDLSIKLWQISESGFQKAFINGVESNLSTPLVELRGHTKKVNLIKFHPTAEGILASAASDQSIKLWDVLKGAQITSIDSMHAQQVVDLVWDYFGRTIATTSKDKHIRIMDPRASVSTATTIENAHEGSKSMKLTFLGSTELLLSTGFNKTSMRQFKMWDPRNTTKEVLKVDIDNASGVIMPFYDPDTSLLYLAGKGDGNIRYYEILNGMSHAISEYKSTVSSKGMAIVPKRGLKLMACETARLLKLTGNSIEPLSFIVPRKSEAFQEDLYPDTAGTEPSMFAEEWFAGCNRPPRMICLTPSEEAQKRTSFSNLSPIQVEASARVTPMKEASVKFNPLPEYDTRAAEELLFAQERIRVLEARIQEFDAREVALENTNAESKALSDEAVLRASELELLLAAALSRASVAEHERDVAIQRVAVLEAEGTSHEDMVTIPDDEREVIPEETVEDCGSTVHMHIESLKSLEEVPAAENVSESVNEAEETGAVSAVDDSTTTPRVEVESAASFPAAAEQISESVMAAQLETVSTQELIENGHEGLDEEALATAGNHPFLEQTTLSPLSGEDFSQEHILDKAVHEEEVEALADRESSPADVTTSPVPEVVAEDSPLSDSPLEALAESVNVADEVAVPSDGAEHTPAEETPDGDEVTGTVVTDASTDMEMTPVHTEETQVSEDEAATTKEEVQESTPTEAVPTGDKASSTATGKSMFKSFFGMRK